jgi:Fe-S oxidoreductase
LVEQWQKNLHSDLTGKDVIFVGCNGQVLPYLFQSPLFQGATIISEPGLCCGEVYYRMGIFSRVEKEARKLEAAYQRANPARIIMFCLAGYNMQKKVLPRNFGFKVKPEIIYLGDWLLEKVKKGEIKFPRPIKRKVVCQESCHAKSLGNEFMEKPRELLRLAGAEVVEMNPCREKQICCGAADGITRFNPMDMVMGGMRQWRLAKKSGAELFVPYCATCYFMLKMAGKFYPSFLPCVHLIELLTYAAGTDLESRADKRAQKIMLKLMAGSAGRIFSRKRIFPEG